MILLQNQVVVAQKRAGVLALVFTLIFAGAFSLFLGAIPASAVGAPSWAQAVDVAAISPQLAGPQNPDPQVVAASDGSLTAIWQGSDGSNTIVQSSHSSNRGASWAAAVNLSGSGQNASFPHIVIAPNGSLTAVWDVLNGSAVTVQASHSADGSHWSAPVDLAAFTGEASSPQIVAAPNGTITAIWQGSANVIQARSSTDGISWSGPVVVSVASGAAFRPQIASAADSSLTAVWYYFDGTGYVIQSSHSVNGSVWSVPANLSGTGPDATNPQIAAGPTGSLTVVWVRFDGVNRIIQASHSANGGVTWSVLATLSASGQDADSPQIAAAPNGTLAVVWARSDGSNTIIQSRRSSDGSAWSAPANLSTTGQNATSPQIAAGPTGALTVVWLRSDGTNNIVQASHSADNGATWDAAVNLSAAGLNANTPHMGVAPSGAVSAIWSRFDGTNYGIQSAFPLIPPVITSGALQAPTAGVAYSAQLFASGAPLPTFAVTTGSLPPGLTLSVTGLISGVPTTAGTSPFTITANNGAPPDAAANYALTVGAAAGSGVGPGVAPAAPSTAGPIPAVATPAPATPTPQPTITPTPSPSATPVVAPVLELVFGFTVGERADGGGLTVKGDGFLPDSTAVITLHSTPTTLGTIAISPGGSFDQTLALPTSLDPGVHHVEVAYTGSDGTATSQSWYFRVDGAGIVTNIQSRSTANPPTWAPVSSHPHTNAGPGTAQVGGVTYQRYLPSLHAAQVVDTVVSSLVLLTVLGGVGAASVFAAGGSIAMAGSAAAAGGARGSTAPSRTGESKSASLASAKVKHLKFRREATAWGDRSSTWAWLGSQRVDSLSVALPVLLNRFSPLLARVSNDGAYLRAMFGPLWLLTSLVGIALGALSIANTHGAAVPPAAGLMIAIVVLSAFDVLGGLLAASTFTIGIIALGGLNTIADVRTILGIDVIFFTVALAASAARPLRRLPAVSASDWFDRAADVVIASLIGTWAVTKMIGALPALSGLALPIANSAVTVALFAGGAIVLRYVLETVATYHYPLRLASVAPPKIGFPSAGQQVVSAVFKTALFVFVAIAYLGNVWPLWIGAALFFIPSVVAAFQGTLPNVPRLVRLIPGGVIKIVLMLCVGKVLGGWLASSIHNPQDFIDQAFVILAIPSFLLGFAGFFGREGKGWGLNWPMRVGGAVLVGFGVLLVLGVIRIP